MISVPQSKEDVFVYVPSGLSQSYLSSVMSRAIGQDVSVTECTATNLCAGHFGSVSNSGATVLQLSLTLNTGETSDLVAKILSPAEVNLFKIDCRFDSREAEIKWAQWWGYQDVPFAAKVYDTRCDRISREFWILQESFRQIGWPNVTVSGMKAFETSVEHLAALFRHAADLHAHSIRRIDELMALFPETCIRHGYLCRPTMIADSVDGVRKDAELCEIVGLTQDECGTLGMISEAVRQRPQWVDNWRYVCVTNDLAPDNFALRRSGNSNEYVTFDWGAAYLAPMEQDIQLLLWRIREMDHKDKEQLLRDYLDAFTEQTGYVIEHQAFVARMPWARLLHHLRLIVEHAESLRWVPHQTRSRDQIRRMVPYCSELLSECRRHDHV